jgi:xanthine/uracil permease
MSASFVVSVGRYQVLNHFGLESPEYGYFYFYSDALLTICLYLALITLYVHVFDEMKAEKYLRIAAVALLGGTALFSYGVVQQSSHRMLTHFFFELSQNLYFVGLILTYVLWGAILKLRETRTRLVQLVLSLGVYFSLFAATYALRNMFPSLQEPRLMGNSLASTT